MKKILVSILAIMFMCINVHASDFFDGKEFMTYTVLNTDNGTKVTLIPTTSIYPVFDRIIGWEITKYYNNTSNAEMFVEIYDSDSTDIQVTDEVIAEAEYTSYDTNGRFFTFPRNIVQGVCVRQGSNTMVTIYFDR